MKYSFKKTSVFIWTRFVRELVQLPQVDIPLESTTVGTIFYRNTTILRFINQYFVYGCVYTVYITRRRVQLNFPFRNVFGGITLSTFVNLAVVVNRISLQLVFSKVLHSRIFRPYQTRGYVRLRSKTEEEYNRPRSFRWLLTSGEWFFTQPQPQVRETTFDRLLFYFLVLDHFSDHLKIKCNNNNFYLYNIKNIIKTKKEKSKMKK